MILPIVAAVALAPPRGRLSTRGRPAARAKTDAAPAGRELVPPDEELLLKHRAARLVAERLAAGEIDLEAAAAELEAIYGDWPAFLDGLRMAHPGDTDRERFARCAASKVRALVGCDPGAAARVDAELEALYPPHR